MKIRYFSGELWEESYVRAKLPNEDIFFHAGPLATFKDLSDADTEVLCTFIVIICAVPAVRAAIAGGAMPDIPLQWAGAAVTLYLGQKTISNFSSSETATRGGGNESQ